MQKNLIAAKVAASDALKNQSPLQPWRLVHADEMPEQRTVFPRVAKAKTSQDDQLWTQT